MIRLLYLRYRRRLIRYAITRCREMAADAAYSEQHYREQLRAVEAAIAMAKAERRMNRYRVQP